MKKAKGPIHLRAGVKALTTITGLRLFIGAALPAGMVAFFAQVGVLTLLFAALMNDYGGERALAEMKLVSGDVAMLWAWSILSMSFGWAAIVAALFGLLFGLKATGRAAVAVSYAPVMLASIERQSALEQKLVDERDGLRTFVDRLGFDPDRVATELGSGAANFTCKHIALSALQAQRDWSRSTFSQAGIDASNQWLDSLQK